MAAATTAESKQHKVSDSIGTNPKEAKKDRMKWAVRLLSWVPTLACLSLCALLAFRLVNLESKVEVIQWQLQKLQNIQTSQLHQNNVPRQKRSIQTDKTDEECSCTGLPGKTRSKLIFNVFLNLNLILQDYQDLLDRQVLMGTQASQDLQD